MNAESGEKNKKSILVQKINGELINISDYSELIKTVNAEARLLRIYAAPDKKEIVKKIINEI